MYRGMSLASEPSQMKATDPKRDRKIIDVVMRGMWFGKRATTGAKTPPRV